MSHKASSSLLFVASTDEAGGHFLCQWSGQGFQMKKRQCKNTKVLKQSLHGKCRRVRVHFEPWRRSSHVLINAIFLRPSITSHRQWALTHFTWKYSISFIRGSVAPSTAFWSSFGVSPERFDGNGFCMSLLFEIILNTSAIEFQRERLENSHDFVRCDAIHFERGAFLSRDLHGVIVRP